MAKIVYLLGAGASANAIPVVNGLTNRFKYFCRHYQEYLKNNGNDSADELGRRHKLIKEIETHYTIDTYAKKLFLKNRNLHANTDYHYLINYLSAFFIYEQLEKNLPEQCNLPLRGALISSEVLGGVFSWVEGFSIEYEDDLRKSIINHIDYRYDSFFASVLKYNEHGNVVMPDNISIVSWNYDAQVEKAYMNFVDCDYDQALKLLNVCGLNNEEIDIPEGSCMVKLNGTAGFKKNDSYNAYFDYKNHKLDKESFRILREVLSANRQEYDNTLRFAWEGNSSSTNAKNIARKLLGEADVIVIIGYSFPYFNRDVDRFIFADVHSNTEDGQKIYLQAPGPHINSIAQRFNAIDPFANIISVSEVDQFFIPDEM